MSAHYSCVAATRNRTASGADGRGSGGFGTRPLRRFTTWRARQAGVLGTERACGATPSRGSAARAGWLVRRYQVAAAVADQIRPAHAAQRLAQQWPVVGIVVAQKRLVQAAHLQAFGDQHR